MDKVIETLLFTVTTLGVIWSFICNFTTEFYF